MARVSKPHPFADRWNHNTHYYPLLASTIPADARTVLDIGCGDGSLARFIAGPRRQVLAVDLDASVLPEATDGVSYLTGSATELPIASQTVDAVSIVMVLHHCEAAAALSEARRVLRPGGTLLVLGYGRSRLPPDLPAEIRDAVAHRIHRRGKLAWEPPTVKADPSMSWRAARQLLARELPGSSYRRLPMWRYLVRWQNPGPGSVNSG